MRKITTVASFVIAIILFSTDVHTQQKFSRVVTDADRWTAMEFNASAECAGTPEECAVKMLAELNVSVGDEPDFSVYQLGAVGEKNVTVVFVSHLPEDDEVVLGNLYRLELNYAAGEGAKFQLAGLGRLFQCLEGPAGWQKVPCQ